LPSRIHRALLQLLVLVWVMAPSPDALAAPRIVLQPVVTNLVGPVYVTHARDGSNRFFVVEQSGRIKVLAPDATEPTVFLDLTSRVLAGGERGLLGLAFHPGYESNGRFFVNYTRQPDGATVIAEYQVSPNDPNVASGAERTLLVIPQPFPNHNGGMVEFGLDGFLYVGTGDGGGPLDPGNRAQNPADLLGKILRLDVDALGNAPVTIFALGFRNPWRFSFDRATGALYVGDVGEGAREEIDIVTSGGNYGWRVLEGTRCTGTDPSRCGEPGFVAPVAEYEHTSQRCSVTGGYAYRGNAGTLPSGAYVFADLCSGEIFLLDGGGQSLLLATDLAIASFGEDQAGELYVVSLGGTVHRLVNPDAPTLSLAVNQSVLRTGDTLQITLGMRNGETPVAADEYFGILHPDGTTVTFLTSLTPPSGSTTNLAADARTFPPLTAALVLDAGTNLTLPNFFTFTLTGAEAPGAYVVFAALVRPGHLADGRVDPGDLLALATATVVVAR
jgi:hypothetical protein